MAQMKEQIRTPEKKLNKTKQSNPSDAEFKILVIRMLKELSEDLNNVKKIQAEMKGTLIEIKDNLLGNNSGMDEAENQIYDLKYKEAKNRQLEQQEENRIQNSKNSIRSLWNNFKCSNIHTIGVPEEEKL